MLGASPPPPPAGGADVPPPPRASPSSRALTIFGPVYMLLGWLTLVVFLLMLSGALDGLQADQILAVDWGRLFMPLWVRDGAGFLFALHLVRYRSMGTRAKATAAESILNVFLSVVFKLNVLQRIQAGSGSIRLVCLPIYLTMLISILARAVKSAATPPDQRASSNLGLGIGVTHLLAITVACKLDGVSSYGDSSWTTTLWPLWLGLGALGVGVLMLACCFAPFLVCFSADHRQRRGPTERLLGPIMVVVTLLALAGWACALDGCLHISLWLDGDESQAMNMRWAFVLLAGAALCALLIGWCLAIIVLVQGSNAGGEGSEGEEPAISLEEMMSRAVKPKQLIKQSSTLFKRSESLLSYAADSASDAPAADTEGNGGDRVDAHIIAAYAKEAERTESEGKGDSDVCWICESGPREAVFLECGHGGVCYVCAEKCWSSQRRHGCPLCRQPVTQIVRVAPGARTRNGQLVVDVLS